MALGAALNRSNTNLNPHPVIDFDSDHDSDCEPKTATKPDGGGIPEFHAIAHFEAGASNSDSKVSEAAPRFLHKQPWSAPANELFFNSARDIA
jgi:hypothetical protein